MKNNIYPRTCKECGGKFPGGPRAWYCPDCRIARRKKKNAEYRARKRNGKSREIGSCDFCQNCGKKYIVSGSLQKYCPICAPEMHRALDRVQGLEYYERNKDKINPPRKIARRKKKLCERCGKDISAVGKKRFCDSCAVCAKKEIYSDQVVERNIRKRGNSYVAYVCYKGKAIFLKSTRNLEKAIFIRDYAEAMVKHGSFEKWFEEFRTTGRKL